MPPPYERQKSSPNITDHSDIVTIEIPEGKKFTVHAHLLADHSDYFRRALNSGMKEALSLHFHLTEHASNGSMSLFVHWLYANSLMPHYHAKPVLSNSRELILDTWLLADYLQAEGFQDFLVGALAETRLEIGNLASNRDFYFNALKRGDIRRNSGMYHFIVGEFARHISSTEIEKKERQSCLAALEPETHIAITEYLAEHCSHCHGWIKQLPKMDEEPGWDQGGWPGYLG